MIILGDTPLDVVAAHANGAECLGVLTGGDTGETLATAKTVLEVRDLSVVASDAVPGPTARQAIEGVSFALRRGEVLGIGGAMGSGRTALLSTLFGSAGGTVTGSMGC